MPPTKLTSAELNTIFHECRQCGSCCKHYRKILLQQEETEFIEKMGGHVGIEVHLNDLREKGFDQAIEIEKKKGKIYMVHPDNKGCVFLEKRNKKYCCKIYNYRPRTCRGFKCNFADINSMMVLFDDPIHLLGMDRFGRKMQ
ncbi:MAG: YkgJ family cysteine cluster protein [Pseudomonadota bacterium]